MVSIFLLLHAAEASYVSSSSISAFRAAIVRAVWSIKMLLANTLAILNLLDGPVDVDPAFHIIWSRFRMMRRYLAYCPAFLPVPGVLQSVQRAEIWGAIVALQAYWPCHLGIDNLNVVRCIGRLLDADCLAKPLPLVKDGDLFALVRYLLRTRGRDTVRVTKVKGHAKDDDVQRGHVRSIDQQGNIEADIAADLGRRHQTDVLVDARRRLLQARGYWYPVIADLHRFMIAIARVSLNHDGKGGTAPDPLVWDKGSRPKVRRLDIRVNVDLASLLGPPGFLNNDRVQIGAGPITRADISAWPYSVGILVRFTSFLSHLHWPSGSVDMGHFGVSFLELLILFEQWAGHRLLSEKVTRPHVRAGRPISVSSVPVSEGIEIRHGCQFLSSLVRALGKLPGGLVRFLPCQVGSHFFRLRHLGWNQCSHGLTSRPLESCHHLCLSAICGILGYPRGSAAELLDGVLKLRCCTTPFSNRFPTWSLHPVGNGRIRSLVVATSSADGNGSNVGKRVRLTRKTRFSVMPVSIPDQGQRRGDGKDCAPLPPKEWEDRSANLAIFFLDLELGEFCNWGRLEPAFGGNRRRAFAGWTVQPKGLVRWHQPV